MARLSALLVSRFLLHLQSASLRSVGSDIMASSQTLPARLDDSLVFGRIVGSLGASITSDDYLDQGVGWDAGARADGDEETTQASREWSEIDAPSV